MSATMNAGTATGLRRVLIVLEDRFATAACRRQSGVKRIRCLGASQWSEGRLNGSSCEMYRECEDDDPVLTEIEWAIEGNEQILVQFASQELALRDAERAERGNPIDGEWLESIGGYLESEYGGDEGYYTIDVDSDSWLSVEITSMIVTIVILGGRRMMELGPMNRGQLLDLLSAMKGG